MFLNIDRYWRKLLGILTPIALSPLLIVIGTQEAKCAYAILWLAIYYVFEPIPIPVTSLLPVLLYPLMGIMSTDETCKLYFKDIIMMYMEALILALAIEYCNLHKRIALKVLLLLGTSIRRLMIGFILVSALLSMWLINTATTAMMTPIVDALIIELKNKQQNPSLPEKNRKTIEKTEEEFQEIIDEESNNNIYYERLRTCLLLSIAYASTCGGTATVIGTGANFVLLGLLEEKYPNSKLTFSTWLMYNAPTMVICVIAVFMVLQTFYVGCRFKSNKEEERRLSIVLKKKYEELGSISFHECAVLFIFASLLITWFFKNPKFIEGWSSKLIPNINVSNATPGVAACLLLFLIPADPRNFSRSKSLMNWKTVERKLPWGVLLLFGSGLAVTEGAQKSGLSIWIVDQLRYLNALSPNAILVILCLLIAMITEVLTNMTTATLFLPVVNQMAIAIGVDPLFFMLPITICCSFSFMLPIGNPPCAIVYQAGDMKTSDMMKPGIFLNIICCLIEIIMVNTLGKAIFGFDMKINSKVDIAIYNSTVA
ncbi:Na(+)/citrate cotransporter-like [Centruroides vittatus]|uniref:Na(+)/citrate cotransporter-like n=1 Tax=Centruroides vittatus TaxID=120091 RepID=UPI00350F9001